MFPNNLLPSAKPPTCTFRCLPVRFISAHNPSLPWRSSGCRKVKQLLTPHPQPRGASTGFAHAHKIPACFLACAALVLAARKFLTDVSKGHPNLDTPSLRLPSQVIVDRIKLTKKTDNHKEFPFHLAGAPGLPVQQFGGW